MDRDHKYSGTLPLLAYAPQDFGHNAQRSRAYRARAAMGRAGVQPLRSQVQAPPVAVKVPVVEVPPKPKFSLFSKLWRRALQLLRKQQKTETAPSVTASAVASPKVTAPVAQSSTISRPHTLNHKPVEQQSVPEQRVIAETITVQETSIEDARPVEPHLTVSKNYASMRMSNVAAVVNDQTIPQAPDLAHALAEIRQALREHEKLANAKQRDISL